MDAQVVDIPYEKVVPEMIIVQQVPVMDSVVVHSGDKAYSVDLSAVGKDEKEGRITVSLYTLKEHNDELVHSMHRGNDEYYRTLASLSNDSASTHEVGKLLQYNDGSAKIYDSEYCYIPEDFNKNESLNFMRSYASKLMADGRLAQDDTKVKFAGQLLAYENTLRDNSYNAVNVQSVFNTIAIKNSLTSS